MRNVLVTLCIVATFQCTAQTCESIVPLQVDKFTKDTSFVSEIIDLPNNGNGMFWHIKGYPQSSKSTPFIVFSVGPEKSACIDDSAPITFLFDDQTTIEIKAGNKYNCDGIAKLYFINSGYGSEKMMSDLQLLKSKKVVAIRIKLYKGVNDHDLTKKQSEDLTCAINTLIKQINL